MLCSCSHILMTVLYIDYRTVPHACALAHACPAMSRIPLVIATGISHNCSFSFPLPLSPPPSTSLSLLPVRLCMSNTHTREPANTARRPSVDAPAVLRFIVISTPVHPLHVVDAVSTYCWTTFQNDACRFYSRLTSTLWLHPPARSAS